MRFTHTSMDGWSSHPHRRKVTRILAVATATVGLAVSAQSAMAQETVIAAAGELACDPADPNYNSGNGQSGRCQAKAVSDAILADTDVQAFLPLGNLQNYCGGGSAYSASYDASYGRLKSKSFPVPGLVEYRTQADAPTGTGCEADVPADPPATGFKVGTASGYFGYWGSAGHLPADAKNSAKGFYSHDIGSWKIISINTNEACAAIACRGADANATPRPYKGSAQEQWLRNELAAAKNRCVLVTMHAPRWSSNRAAQSATYGNVLRGIWTDLYEGGADVLLGAYARNYERFHPMNASGARDNTLGVRQFVVGTGGIQFESNQPAIANSAFMYSARQYGYLRMTLRDGSFGWSYRNVGGADIDAGSANCHGAPAKVTTPAVNATVTAGGATTFTANVPAPEATDSVDFFIGTTKVATASKATAVCHTDIINDPAVYYTSPYCTYTATGNTRGALGGKTIVRAVANSTDTATPSATQAGPANAITFKNGLTSIFTMTTNSSSVNRIATALNGAVKDPEFSNNRTKIAWTSPQGIVVANANGSNAVVVPGTIGASAPDWGPSDAKLFYLKGGAIYSIPVAGGAATRIAAGRILSLSANPNGSRVLYQVRMGNGRSDIFVMNASGSGKKNLTKTTGVSEVQPTWKNATVFGFAVKTTRWAVYNRAVSGGRTTRITSLLQNCQQPAYSPGGLRLACVSLAGSTSTLRVMRPNGTSARSQSTGRPMPTQPTWGSATVVGFTAS